MKKRTNDNAESEIVGALMLIAVLVAVAGVFISGLTISEQGKTLPRISVTIYMEDYSNAPYDTIHILHKGGDIIFTGDYYIRLVDQSSHSDEYSPPEDFKPGTDISYTKPVLITVPFDVQVIYRDPTDKSEYLIAVQKISP